MTRLLRPLAILATVLLAALPGRAAELDPYLPGDTENVLNVNVRQILDSPLIKKHALEAGQEALRGNDQVQDILNDLGFDPFKDLDRVLIASPGGTDKDRGLVIVHGRFDLTKFKAKAEQVAKDNPDNLKILGGKHLLYEVNVPDLDMPLFVALAGRDTLLVSAGKDYVVDALKKTKPAAKEGETQVAPGKPAGVAVLEKPALKNKDFQKLLQKVDARQSVSLAAVQTKAVKDAINGLPGDVKGMIEKIQALGGGVTITDEIKMELIVTTKTAKEAEDLSDSANKGLTLVLAFLGTLAQKDSPPQMEFFLEAVKSLRVRNRESAVVIKGRISSDVIEEMMKKAK